MLRRLKSQLGETMVETLVSILISALAMTVLATVIGTSVNMVMRSKYHMDEFYDTESTMIASGPSGQNTLSIEVPLEVGQDEMTVDVYSAGNNTDIVYYKQHEGGAGQ